MRNPAAGQSQGADPDNTLLDAFVREYLSTILMTMTPRDSVLSDPANNWLLADERRTSLLVYSLTGDTINFNTTLPRRSYTGLWFNPRTGKTTPAEAPINTNKGAGIRKPTAEDWLLLLRVD
jgi:hypothetical protein